MKTGIRVATILCCLTLLVLLATTAHAAETLTYADLVSRLTDW